MSRDKIKTGILSDGRPYLVCQGCGNNLPAPHRCWHWNFLPFCCEDCMNKARDHSAEGPG